MSIKWELIDKVIYLNKNRGNKREGKIKQECNSVGLLEEKLYIIDAEDHLIEYIAEATLHFRAIEAAVTNGWGTVLVVDDGFILNKIKDSTDHVNYFFYALNSLPWSAAILNGDYKKFVEFKSTNRLVKLTQVFCPQAYIVHADYRVAIFECFKNALKNLKGGGSIAQFSMDKAWEPLMQRDCWLGIYPAIN